MISRISSFFKLYREALFFGLLSGVFVGTSYIPLTPWALLFCYAPLWFFALKQERSLREIFWAGWVTQFTLTLIGFHWIAYVAHEFGYMPWPVATFLLLLFAAAMHLYIPLSLSLGIWLTRRLNLSKGASLVALACLLALAEQFWPSIFAWNLGYPLLWAQSPLAQWADVIGFSGLSFFIYLSSAWVAWLLLRQNLKWAAGTSFAVTAALVLAFWGGVEKQKQWQNPPDELKLLLVQANIGNVEKIAAEKGRGFQQEIINNFFELTRQGLQQHPETELIVWPETAFPSLLNPYAQRGAYTSQFYEFARSIQKPILTGAYSKDSPGKAVRDDYNAVFLFDSQGQMIAEPYHKTQLLIFGEYIPFGREFPILAKLNPGGAGWGRGTGPTVLPHPQAGLGIQICYESLDPLFSSALANLGADILVNVTNDSWFGPRFEPYQHLWMTAARAVETRKPLIRSTNTGISTVVLADGRVLEQSPLFEKWQGFYSVKFQKNSPLSFYSRFGSWLPLSIFVLLLGTLWIGRNRGRILSSRLERNS